MTYPYFLTSYCAHINHIYHKTEPMAMIQTDHSSTYPAISWASNLAFPPKIEMMTQEN